MSKLHLLLLLPLLGSSWGSLLTLVPSGAHHQCLETEGTLEQLRHEKSQMLLSRPRKQMEVYRSASSTFLHWLFWV